MNNIRFQKLSKKTLLLISLALLVSSGVLVYALQIQQDIRQRASEVSWFVGASAKAVCSPDTGSASIQVSFTNKETLRDIDVVAMDEESGEKTDLGTIKAGDTKTGVIQFDNDSRPKGTVTFDMTWTDGSSGKDSREAAYAAVSGCNKTPTPTSAPVCEIEDQDKGYCRWDGQDNATEYDVVVKERATGEIITERTVKHPTTEVPFVMEPLKSYTCSVTAKNACGTGESKTSPEKECPFPTPSPTRPPVCPVGPVKEGACVWDLSRGVAKYHVKVINSETGEVISEKDIAAPANKLVFPANPGDTYECSVKGINACAEGPEIKSSPKTCAPLTPTPTLTPSPTPTPTGTPTPTVTPIPPTKTPTPTPRPTATPGPPPPTRSVPPPINNNRVINNQTTVNSNTSTNTNTSRTSTSTNNVIQQTNQQQVAVQTTPLPTMVPTGNPSTTTIFAVATAVLTAIGGVLFFAL